MSSWGNNDNAANTPLWSAMSVKRKPNSANTTALFDNVTANTFITGRTDGVFGVDASEATVAHGGVHTGWVLKTTGQGGRAGRVQQEVLVAMNTIKLDADGQIYPNTSITITSQPTSNTKTAPAVATFKVAAKTNNPASTTLSYLWQADNGTGYGFRDFSAANEPAFTGWNTNTLTVITDVAQSGYLLRCVVSATANGVSATSGQATLTVA